MGTSTTPSTQTPPPSGEETIARPRKFQDFAATHQGVVAEHVASLLATRDVARLMRTAKDLKGAGELEFVPRRIGGVKADHAAKPIDRLLCFFRPVHFRFLW